MSMCSSEDINLEVYDSLADLAAVSMGVLPGAVVLTRSPQSFTNYVFRAEAGAGSIYLKHSDNIASMSQCSLPERHILAEYNFLSACKDIKIGGVRTPEPICYDKSNNTLVMHNLGDDGVHLHQINRDSVPPALLLYQIGVFLRSVHLRSSWPEVLLSILDREKENFEWATFKLKRWQEYEPSWSASEPFLQPTQPGLTIVDFTPQNCLVQSDGTIGLFDFDFVSYADQLLDLANFQSRLIFLAAVGQIPSEKLELIDALLLGYYDGDLQQLEKKQSAWRAFCRYLAASMHYRFLRDHGAVVAAKNVGLTGNVFAGCYSSWESLRDGFLRDLLLD